MRFKRCFLNLGREPLFSRLVFCAVIHLLLENSLPAQIYNIDAWLDTCPTVDPIFQTLTNDFGIRTNGVLVTSFPCSGPISTMPIAEYTDQLIMLQELRTIYYIDRGRSNYLPWTSLSLYNWLKSKIGGIDVRTDGGPYCCEEFGGKSYIVLPARDDSTRDQYRHWELFSSGFAVIFHEARHVDGFPHSSCCGISGGCDNAYDENNLSCYGIQWWLNEAWLKGWINVGVGCLTSDRVQSIGNWDLSGCNDTYRTRFCSNLPPVLTLPAFPGGACVPSILSLALNQETNAAVVITNMTVGMVHQVQRSTNLTSGGWQVIDSFAPSQNSIQRQLSLTNRPSAFIRVGVPPN
jgi:hypothetical protein